MCTVLLPLGVNPIAVNKYINRECASHKIWYTTHPSGALLHSGVPCSHLCDSLRPVPIFRPSYCELQLSLTEYYTPIAQNIYFVHLLVCNTQWIFKVHGATIKILSSVCLHLCLPIHTWVLYCCWALQRRNDWDVGSKCDMALATYVVYIQIIQS
jgi:hypothetical protein